MLEIDIHFQRDGFELAAKFAVDSEAIGLYGPSGAGKSTLLSVIAGLLFPQRGTIALDGEILFDSGQRACIPTHHRRIGYVFQDARLFPHLSVEKNLKYGFNRIAHAHRRFTPDSIINLLDLRHLLERRPDTLSGGERQRVALGRAVLASPRLLLLDEPLASLDISRKDLILPYLRRIVSEFRMPTVYVSHSLDEILQLTDNLLVLEGGRMLAQGRFIEVVRDERVLNLAKTLGLVNVLPVTIRENTRDGLTKARVGDATLSLPTCMLPPNAQTFVAVRPEDIALAQAPVMGTSIQNQIAGKIVDLSSVGGRVLVQVDIGTVIVVEISEKACAELSLAVDGTVTCLIKSQAFTYVGHR